MGQIDQGNSMDIRLDTFPRWGGVVTELEGRKEEGVILLLLLYQTAQ